VCEAPATEGGSLQKNGNVAVGEVYTFTCDEGCMFDLDTIEEHGDSEITIPCEKSADDALINSNLPAQHCYSGCHDIKGFNGTITPNAKSKGSAPYSEGQQVTFACNTGYELADSNQGVKTCNNGKIGDGCSNLYYKTGTNRRKQRSSRLLYCIFFPDNHSFEPTSLVLILLKFPLFVIRPSYAWLPEMSNMINLGQVK